MPACKVKLFLEHDSNYGWIRFLTSLVTSTRVKPKYVTSESIYWSKIVPNKERQKEEKMLKIFSKLGLTISAAEWQPRYRLRTSLSAAITNQAPFTHLENPMACALYSCGGKTHSHSTVTHCQNHRCRIILVSNNASWIHKFRDPSEPELWPFCRKTGKSVTGVIGEYFLQIWRFYHLPFRIHGPGRDTQTDKHTAQFLNAAPCREGHIKVIIQNK